MVPTGQRRERPHSHGLGQSRLEDVVMVNRLAAGPLARTDGDRPVIDVAKSLMTIEYDTSVDDLLSFQRYCWHYKMRGRHSFGYALALANGLALGHLLTTGSIVSYAVCSALLLLIWSLFVYVVAPAIAKRQLGRGKHVGIVGRHVIRLEVGGCRETTDVNESFHAWRGVDAIEADARYVYIFIHGGGAYFIPRRAFPHTAASDEFLAAATRLHAAASSS